MQMLKALISKNKVVLWQIGFLLTGTSWLFAPLLNNTLSSRSTLISEYETSLQPYSWFFRLFDALSAVLFLLAVAYILRQTRHKKAMYIFLIGIGVLLLLDP